MTMFKSVVAGTADVSVIIRIVDSTDGTPETGVVYNTSGIDLEYRREGAASVDITEATLSALTDAHTDGGFLHIGNGYYRLDLPDAACAIGVSGVMVHGTVTGMVVIGCYVTLTGGAIAGLVGPDPDKNIVEAGVAQSVTSTTLVARSAATNDIVKAGNTLMVYSTGTAYWQSVMIDSVSGDTFTIAAWPTATPSGTVYYHVIGTPQVSVNVPIAADVRRFGGTAGTFSSGRPEVNTTHAAGTAWNSGAIGASTLASDTITAAKIAADAITAAKIADGAIDAATFSAGAINAAAIAADAIGASELATDAVVEIVNAVWAAAARTLTALDEDSTTLDLDATIRAALGMASANLDTQITTLATANNLAIVAGYIDTEVATIIANLATVDTVVDAILALLDDARTEPGQGNPPVNPDVVTKIDYLYKAWRNRSTTTASQYTLYADNGTTVDQKATISDDLTTYSRGEIATGP